MAAAPAVRAPIPGHENKIAIQLGDDRLVAVGLMRIDEEGALVLSIPHPDVLAAGRPVLCFWQREDRWTPLPTRVGAPRFKPHPDAGRLRLLPEARPVDRTSVGTKAAEAAAAVAADGAAPAATPAAPKAAPWSGAEAAAETQAPKTEQKQAAPDDAKAAPGIAAWHGRHPTTNVALRLGSGRVRTIEVRRLDEDGALVLSLPRPSMLGDGAAIEIAWSERRDWFTADVHVAPLRPDGHADAGLLRLLPGAAPVEHRERRASLRFPIKVGVRGRVEKGAVQKGTTFSTESLDLSEGGVAFPCELDLAKGDVVMGRLLGPTGQLGDEVTLLIRRVTPIPGQPGYRIACSFEKPSKAFERAIKQHILTYC